jgi:hypothetical protein
LRRESYLPTEDNYSFAEFGNPSEYGKRVDHSHVLRTRNRVFREEEMTKRNLVTDLRQRQYVAGPQKHRTQDIEGMSNVSLSELRQQAKSAGFKGYYRLPKARLSWFLEPVVVWKGDCKAVRYLGSEYLRSCKVHRWEEVGSGQYHRWLPQAWLVPRFRLGDITPLSEEEARTQRDAASETASEAYRKRMREVSGRIGALPTSRTTRAVAFGQIDEDSAELIAFKTSYRHQETNYDQLIRAGEEKEFARGLAEESEIPAVWEDYLCKYEFDSPQAKAMVKVLKDPRSAHPVWFKEAEIALRHYQVSLEGLTYERIRQAIDAWRAEQEED